MNNYGYDNDGFAPYFRPYYITAEKASQYTYSARLSYGDPSTTTQYNCRLARQLVDPEYITPFTLQCPSSKGYMEGSSLYDTEYYQKVVNGNALAIISSYAPKIVLWEDWKLYGTNSTMNLSWRIGQNPSRTLAIEFPLYAPYGIFLHPDKIGACYEDGSVQFVQGNPSLLEVIISTGSASRFNQMTYALRRNNPERPYPTYP
jgi:hypothetical protein